MIELHLPFPPSVNGYWRNYNGRQILSKKAREFRQASLLALRGLSGLFGSKSRLSVVITLHAPDKRKRDIDNYTKAACDAVTHAGIWEDDSQIDKLLVIRGQNQKGGRCMMVIEEYLEVGK